MNLAFSAELTADLIAVHAGVERVLGGEHGATDEYAEQNDGAVVRVIAQLVTPHANPTHSARRNHDIRIITTNSAGLLSIR